MLLGPVAAGLLLFGAATPAHAAPAAELITPVAPVGFTPASLPGGTGDGSFDLDRMASLAGVDPPSGLDDVGWSGAARLWSGPGGQVAMVIAGRTDDPATAQEGAAGALAGALDVDGSSTFASSLPDVDGVTATRNGARAEFVAWSQGQYLVMAVAATTGDDTHALIDDLVTRQSDFLRTRYGASTVANRAADSGIDPKLLVGGGVLLLVLFGIGFGAARRRRSATEPPAPFAPAGVAATGRAVAAPDPPTAPRAPRPAPAPIPFVRDPKPAPPPVPFRPGRGPGGRAVATAPRTDAPAPAGGTPSWDDRFPTGPAD